MWCDVPCLACEVPLHCTLLHYSIRKSTVLYCIALCCVGFQLLHWSTGVPEPLEGGEGLQLDPVELNSLKERYLATAGVACCRPSASTCTECTSCSRPTPTGDCSYASCAIDSVGKEMNMIRGRGRLVQQEEWDGLGWHRRRTWVDYHGSVKRPEVGPFHSIHTIMSLPFILFTSNMLTA